MREECEQREESEVMTPQELADLRSRCEVGRDVLLYQPATVLRILNTVDAVVRERDEARAELARLVPVLQEAVEAEEGGNAAGRALLRLTRTFPWLAIVAAAGYTDEVARRELDLAYHALPSAPMPSRDELGWVATVTFHGDSLEKGWPKGFSEAKKERWRRVGEALARAVLAGKQYCQMCGNTLDGYEPPLNAAEALKDLPELSPSEKALADELGPDYATRVMVASDWMKKGGWRDVPEDLEKEILEAGKAGCKILGWWEWPNGSRWVTEISSVGALPDHGDFKGTCWFPLEPEPPGGKP